MAAQKSKIVRKAPYQWEISIQTLLSLEQARANGQISYSYACIAWKPSMTDGELLIFGNGWFDNEDEESLVKRIRGYTGTAAIDLSWYTPDTDLTADPSQNEMIIDEMVKSCGALVADTADMTSRSILSRSWWAYAWFDKPNQNKPDGIEIGFRIALEREEQIRCASELAKAQDCPLTLFLMRERIEFDALGTVVNTASLPSEGELEGRISDMAKQVQALTTALAEWEPGQALPSGLGICPEGLQYKSEGFKVLMDLD